MANSGLGQDGYVRVQKETTYGTDISSSMTLLPIKAGGNIAAMVENIDNDNVIGNRLKQAPNVGRTVIKNKAPYVMDMYPDLMGAVMNWCFGASTNAGPADSTYTHTWLVPTSGEKVTTALSIQQAKGSDTAEKFNGCRLLGFEIVVDNKGNGSISMNFVGQSYTEGVSRISTFTYPSTAPFNFSHFTVSESGLGAIEVQSLKIVYNASYDEERYRLGSVKIKNPVYKDIPKLTMEMVIDADKQFLTAARAHTSYNFTITLTHTSYAAGTTPYSMVFEIPGNRLSTDTEIPNSSGRLNMTLSFESSFGGTTTGSPSANVMGEVRVVDATATYAATTA